MYAYITPKERDEMLSTALAIQDATKQAINEDVIVNMATNLFIQRDIVSEEDFVKLLFKYSAALSAVTATLVTSVCLTEQHMNDMISVIEEMETMGKEAL